MGDGGRGGGAITAAAGRDEEAGGDGESHEGTERDG